MARTASEKEPKRPETIFSDMFVGWASEIIHSTEVKPEQVGTPADPVMKGLRLLGEIRAYFNPKGDN